MQSGMILLQEALVLAGHESITGRTFLINMAGKKLAYNRFDSLLQTMEQ